MSHPDMTPPDLNPALPTLSLPQCPVDATCPLREPHWHPFLEDGSVDPVGKLGLPGPEDKKKLYDQVHASMRKAAIRASVRSYLQMKQNHRNNVAMGLHLMYFISDLITGEELPTAKAQTARAQKAAASFLKVVEMHVELPPVDDIVRADIEPMATAVPHLPGLEMVDTDDAPESPHAATKRALDRYQGVLLMALNAFVATKATSLGEPDGDTFVDRASRCVKNAVSAIDDAMARDATKVSDEAVDDIVKLLPTDLFAAPGCNQP